jgi:2-dehydro-3-deoxy-D-gluconate 5-dehydrogenase
MSLFDLSGRVAIVTGGNGGIGLGMAKGLAAAGAAVVVAARNREKSEAAVAELAGLGVRSAFIPLDVADPQSCRAVIRDAADRFGGIDILINNAGMSIRKPPESYTVEEWHRVLDTNLTGALVCCQAAYPHLQRRGGGKIVNIGSMMAIFGAAYAAAYSASKGAIVQLTKSLATAWAKDNIQVNGVAGLDRHRIDARRPPPGAGAQRAHPEPDTGRPLGRARRPRRRGRVPRRAGVGFRDRRRDPGRRRLFRRVLSRRPARRRPLNVIRPGARCRAA